MIRLLIIILLVLFSGATHAQVIISLLLGDKLNSGKIEFGLEGGVNYTEFAGLSDDVKANFNLGFYFDIKLKNPVWKVHTGVIVKSTLGSKGIPVYSLDQPDLDNIFEGGEVVRTINYFNVPVLMKYTMKERFFLQGGIQLGLRTKGRDTFYQEINNKDDLTFTREIQDNYYRIDGGVVGGIGYRLMSGNGMNLSINYYLGLIDITVEDSTRQFNRSLYLSVGIPIGAGKKKDNTEN